MQDAGIDRIKKILNKKRKMYGPIKKVLKISTSEKIISSIFFCNPTITSEKFLCVYGNGI